MSNAVIYARYSSDKQSEGKYRSPSSGRADSMPPLRDIIS